MPTDLGASAIGPTVTFGVLGLIGIILILATVTTIASKRRTSSVSVPSSRPIGTENSGDSAASGVAMLRSVWVIA